MPVRASLTDPTAAVSNRVTKLVVSVTTGDDQTFENVLLDTGSGALWVGASTPYIPGPNSVSTGDSFIAGYDEGSAEGLVYLDTVTIGSAMVSNQFIGAANATSLPADLSPLDGFLGLALNGSNEHIFTGNDTPTNTFVDNLVQQGIIEHEIWSLVVPSLDPTSGPQSGEGEILFGGFDESKIQGDIAWVDVTNPINNFGWNFNMDGIFFGDTQISNDTIFSTTDSGNIWISLNIFTYLEVEQAVPGTTNVIVGDNEFLVFPANVSLADLPLLRFSMGGQNFTLSGEQYVISSNVYPTFNITDDGRHYSWFGTAGLQRDAVLGQAWLQYFYSIYDVENNKIGFANYA
ncbi:hypothetical protein PsYK624_094540 [Phanerochaete sordida]|uniref:Peptidase A1 domain-containing protein n=1 Tax=Phanerochaete sordida TaxID=48140 RepID=A0A9P3LFH1_9APHY|nr:hypothetical protein PsYK624_094540 [Phanerochaete sordida]